MLEKGQKKVLLRFTDLNISSGWPTPKKLARIFFFKATKVGPGRGFCAYVLGFLPAVIVNNKFWRMFAMMCVAFQAVICTV